MDLFMLLPTTQIDLAGSSMNVVDVGAGPPVLLGHGYLFDAEMWAPQIERLSQHFRVIVPEMWGHGSSGKMPPGTHTTADLARQHLMLMDCLGIGRCSVVGLSLGGMWAAELALLSPQRVVSLALLDSSLAAEPDGARAGYAVMFDLVSQNGRFPEPVIDALVPMFFASSTDPQQLAYHENLAARLRAWDPTRLLDSILPIGKIILDRRDALDDLSTLSMPALVATGAEDRARPPEEGRAMAQRIGCAFVEISHAGHITSLEAPAIVSSLLEDFLTQTEAA
jgi:pimeloyl-ACP methyl ester carboxylesterase